MLPEFPDLPETPVIRQIECVSCRHQFSTSEEIITPFQRAVNVFRMRGRRRVIDHRMTDDVLVQNVVPESDAQTRHYQTPEERNQPLHRQDTIICPRCGTNNQNWAFIHANLKRNWVQQPVIFFGMLVILALLASAGWQMWVAGTPIQYQVILVSLGLFLFLFVIPQSLLGLWTYIFRQDQKRRFLPKSRNIWEQIPLFVRVYAIYFLALGLVLALITIFIPWGSFFVDETITERTLITRIDDVLNVTPVDSEEDSAPMTITDVKPDAAPYRVAAATTQLVHVVNQVEQACNLSPIASIIVQLESRLGANPIDPSAMLIRNSLNDLHALQTNYNSTCQEDLHERAVASVNAFRKQQDVACDDNGDTAACELRNFLDNQIADLSSLNTYMPGERPLDLNILIPDPNEPISVATLQTVLMRLRPIASSPPSGEIATRIEQNLIPIEQWAETAVPRRSWFTAGGTYLEIWLINFGIAGFISILTALIVAYATAEQARRNLPTPIFASVSRLTPVVIWEAANTMAIPPQILTGIQWRGAQRNELGGVDTHGIFHDAIAAQEYGFPDDYVRAQNYVIRSDYWGRIVNARIYDDIVPPPPGIAANGGILLPDTSQ